jgi:putative tryptophan/tyrosine transport system substrate-binding protein
MRRREFVTLLGSAAVARPIAARAQQPAVPVIGFLHEGQRHPVALTNAFHRGLSESGVIEGRDVTIEDRWAEGQYDRLPALAADLVGRRVAVIAADLLLAGLAAKAATQSIPVVFVTGSDPVAAGLVSSFSRPTGNLTGIAFMFTLLMSKNLQLLRELVPGASTIGVLVNTNNRNSEPQLRELQAAARALGLQLVVLSAASEHEIDSAFASLAGRPVGAMLDTADGFLFGREHQIVALSARYSVPTMYPLSRYVEAGGLISYGANLSDAFRHMGNYVGRVLKGARPGDLPVLQSAKFELVINLQTAKTLGLTVPPTLLATADEVIE